MKNAITLPCSIGDYMLITNTILSERPKLYIGQVKEISIVKDNEIWVKDIYNGEEDVHKIYDGCNITFINEKTASLLSEYLDDFTPLADLLNKEK